MARATSYSLSVFINCPFSADYKPIFQAILFAVYACEFRPRSALEVDDGSEHRLVKIQNMIRQSRFGIHDISNVSLDPTTKLPRFNMPFELGLFLAAKAFGSTRQRNKKALIFDSIGYRYRDSLSDISGLDIKTHGDDVEKAIYEVRNWLDNCRGGDTSFPGGAHIVKQYRSFTKDLPSASKKMKLKADELTFADVCRAMERWFKDNT